MEYLTRIATECAALGVALTGACDYLSMRPLLELDGRRMKMTEELMRLSLYAVSATLGGVGVLLVYLSCYAPALWPHALMMLGIACVVTQFTTPRRP
jgi:hypothetical protein